MIVTIGVDNLVIVDTPDVAFIATKEKAKEVKSIIESFSFRGRYESNTLQ